LWKRYAVKAGKIRSFGIGGVHVKPAPRLFLLVFTIFITATSSRAQSNLGEVSRVPGYEQELAKTLRETLKRFSPKTDNLGNVYITVGSGAPHKLIVTAMDEPGYIVSDITPDGYLRVQRLPQAPPNAVFDLLHAAQPVRITIRNGKTVAGVFAGLSVHLEPRRLNAPTMAHPDEMYVDIGATSAAEVRAAGVNLLDPVAMNREQDNPGEFGQENWNPRGDGGRFGIFALMKLLGQLYGQKIKGTLTVAFVAQQWAGGRGMNRLLTEIHPDEMIFVGHITPKPPLNGKETLETAKPGSGVLIGTPYEPAGQGGSFVEEFKKLAEQTKIRVSVLSENPPRIADYVAGAAYPKRFVSLGVPALWPVTPAESVDPGDLGSLDELLKSYVMKDSEQLGKGFNPAEPEASHRTPADQLSKDDMKQLGTTAPMARVVENKNERYGKRNIHDHETTGALSALIVAYGASGHEGAVREKVAELLPQWAREKTKTDEAGNLILHLGNSKPGTKSPKIAFVAHMDEIGYEVKSIEPDGRLMVEVLGGGYTEYFLGHPVLVHTTKGKIGGVLELPEGWDKPGFEWPHGPTAMDDPAHVYVGTHSADETQKLGLKPGDWVTIPKKYRPLLGTRANGRSLDDRVGCAALIEAVKAVGPQLPGRDVTFIWSTREEVGLEGAAAAAERLAKEGNTPDFVFAIDTFVSSDSPLETTWFADAKLGKGFVVRAVDHSNITPREYVDRVVKLAQTNKIPAQFGVTGGGNDGSVFLRYGSVAIPLGWPLRYSHSPAEVIDTKDEDALAKIIAVLAREW
jgi:putative aminopeptidase